MPRASGRSMPKTTEDRGDARAVVHVQPDADLAHGTHKAAIAQRPSLHVDSEHWIRPTAPNLVKFGPAE